jgi:hypothetical protein
MKNAVPPENEISSRFLLPNQAEWAPEIKAVRHRSGSSQKHPLISVNPPVGNLLSLQPEVTRYINLIPFFAEQKIKKIG